MKIQKNWSKYLLIMLIAFTVGACERDRLHPVPSIPFNTTINLNLPSYQDLHNVGGYAYISGIGSKGVVIYRRSVGQLVAWDRHSPADEEGVCESGLVTDEDNFLVLNDPCSEAQFSLYDGSIIAGDVNWGLRQYRAELYGMDQVQIWN